MKAIVYHRYGSPDVLQFQEIDRPVVSDDDVLVQVRAASANPYDWHFMRGKPYLMRIMSGLLRPKSAGLGVDLAGHVESVGRNVTEFHPGDEVWGVAAGAFAEYVVVSADALVLKPTNLTFEQAAAVPVAGFSALQGLRDQGRIQSGERVLINGASGGVGTFGVQIAKWFGAEVTGVCSTRNLDLVRSIGADQVVDYTREDFTRGGQRYDLMLDTVGNRSLSDCRRVLAVNGTYVLVGGDSDRQGSLGRLFRVFAMSRFVSQKLVTLMAKGNKEDLLALNDLLEAGHVTPVIDRSYRLREVPEAIRYLEEGHARGKVVITV